MTGKFLAFTMVLFISAACSHTDSKNTSIAKSDGEVLSSTGLQTFHAKYTGRDQVQIGDKFNIVEYEPVSEDLRIRESRNLPFMADAKTKKVIGQATVSHVLNDHVYELKTDKPQHVPSDALIQKL